MLNVANVSERWIILLAITASPAMCEDQGTQVTCDGTTDDDDGNPQDQCCQYIVFVDGCCSEEENSNLKLMYVPTHSSANTVQFDGVEKT